jgi:hypothetical protein
LKVKISEVLSQGQLRLYLGEVVELTIINERKYTVKMLLNVVKIRIS